MANERLRAAMVEQRLNNQLLAEELGVHTKTVERWVIHDFVPYPTNRHRLAVRLGVDESYLWPDAFPRDRATAVSESEIVKVYPHRSDVLRDDWFRLFESATSEIGILVYAGLFFAEDSALQRILLKKAKAGIRIRLILGDPDDEHIAERGKEEGVGEGMAFRIRNALLLFQRLRETEGVELRLHRTVLYNSIYLSDGQVLVNTHLYSVPAAQAPVWHLRKVPGGELTGAYLDSFERVWEISVPLPEVS